MSEEGKAIFRRDLFYRIASWVIRLPPLRNRMEDVVPLAKYFLRQMKREGEPPELDRAVCEYLQSRSYPGNVRELRQLVSRMAWRHAGTGPITLGDIPVDERPAFNVGNGEWKCDLFKQSIGKALSKGIGLKQISKETADMAVQMALDLTEGNTPAAARILGISDRALQLRKANDRTNGKVESE